MPYFFSPAQLIENLLKNAEPEHRDWLLRRAHQANKQRLVRQTTERLALEEAGWGDYWQFCHRHTTETLAAIEQALATC